MVLLIVFLANTTDRENFQENSVYGNFPLESSTMYILTMIKNCLKFIFKRLSWERTICAATASCNMNLVACRQERSASCVMPDDVSSIVKVVCQLHSARYKNCNDY